MNFADFSVKSQPIFIKFYTHYFPFMSWLPWKFHEVLKSILEAGPFDIHVIKFWDETRPNGFIEGNIFIYLLHVKSSDFLNKYLSKIRETSRVVTT